MSDFSVKGSSCLAITEKNNNQKQGGSCVGIFFQLFDWNKTLTKKRFFTQKLLPPASGKQDSLNKFKGDEKMPNSKLHLMSNGNNGGFSNAKKGGNCVIEAEQKHEMKVPSLVARLMGLESIPSSKRDKSNISSFSDSDDGEDSLETGLANVRHDSRPQKLRKTEANERRAMTRFGGEALQVKSVLSQVRKYNHHQHGHKSKLVSPLKSPRISSEKSGSRSSRLIEAATKILEPGLQAKSRSKCSLPSSISKCPPNNGIVTEMVGTRPEDTHYQSCYTCKNCSNLLDVEISRSIDSDVFTDFSSALTQDGRTFNPSHENDVVLLTSQEKIITLVDEDVKKNAYSCNEGISRRMHVPSKRNLSRQLRGGLEDNNTSSFVFKHKTQTQERVLSDEKKSFEFGSRINNMQERRVSSAATASLVSGNKDFVGLNRSLSGRTQIRSPTKLDSCKFELERKRRTPDVSQVEGITSVNLVTSKQRNVSFDSHGGKRRSFDAFSPNNSNVESIRGGYQKTDKINRAVSSTFSSPLKKNKETRSDYEIKTCFQRHHPPLRENVLGAFLEQKLKELRSRENKELVNGDQPKRSSALILQELISALNVERLKCTDDRMLNDKGHKYETNHVELFGTSCNGNHLSPGSVLDASFSSSSIEESSGHCFHPSFINCSNDQPEQLENEAKLLGSTKSFNIGKIGCKILTELVNRIHSILQSLDSFWARLTESKLNHMIEVIFNAELILGNVTRHSEDEVQPQLLISCILLDELDNMTTNAIRRNFNRSEIKGFLFDCVIEYLELNCFQHYYSVFKLWCAWTKVPLCIKGEILVREVKSEIKKWECIAGMEPDQIIEWEMSHSLGKWTNFDIEALEAGVDIGGDVLQILLDEIVEDLVNFRKVTV